jgi:glucokinase
MAPMNDKPVIAVDLGGTTIKAGVVRGADVSAAEAIPANATDGLAPQLPRVAALVERVCARAGLAPDSTAGIGMAVPLLVDPVRQRIRSAPRGKYADACDVDLVRWSRERFGVSLRMENDAHAALLGEWRYGAGQGCDDVVMLTIGTGIGCSVLIGGRPLRGRHFQAGVLGGHLIANPLAGTACAACPASGCYEAESAAQSLEREARAQPEFTHSALAAAPSIDFAAVFRHAVDGDRVAAKVRDRCLRHWTALIISLVHAYDPERIIIGGGVSEGADARPFFAAMQDDVNRQAWIVEPIDLRIAQLGNHAGMIGAASIFAHSYQWL